MALDFRPVQLFGGAITADVPADFGDVSDIRQVPDNQEVFLSKSGYTSLTVDLCERVTVATTDIEALDYHLEDIVAEGDTKHVYSKNESIQLQKFPRAPILSLIAKVTPRPADPERRSDPQAPTYVMMILALVRLEAQMTDVVITLNLPNIPGSQELVKDGENAEFGTGVFTDAINKGQRVIAEVLKTLQVRDWALFGPGG